MYQVNALFFLSYISLCSAISRSSTVCDVCEEIRRYNYPCENHKAITEDGYILTMQRVPYGPKCGKTAGIPVILVHGWFLSSAIFFSIGPHSALGFLLADKCYDVWAVNYRGNFCSREHTNLDPDDPEQEFWKFSPHEMGIYDLPAVIDYIVAETKHNKVHYIGYSQGGTGFMICCSQPNLIACKPERFHSVQLIAPAVFLAHTLGLFKFIANFERSIETFFFARDKAEFLPRGENSVMNNMLCMIALQFSQINQTKADDVCKYHPSGTSVRQFLFYAQQTKLKLEFRPYDHHDEEANMKAYGTKVPEPYNISQCKNHLNIWYGSEDILVSPQDTVDLGDRTNSELHLVDTYGHFDFLIADGAKEALYNSMFLVMKGTEN